MTTVALTGASGYLASRVIGRLRREPSVERIVAIDRLPTPTGPKTSVVRSDIRGEQLAEALEGVDLLIHLAFIHDQMADLDEMRSINVDGTAAVIRAAEAAGVRRIVYPSTAMVYGAHEDNDVPLTEASGVRTDDDAVYAMHKRETELLFEQMRSRSPEVRIAVVRSAIVLGASVENFVTRTFQAPRLFSVRGFHPPFQCIHEDDIASALTFAGLSGLDGTFNASADGWLSHDEVAAIAGKRWLDLPPGVAMAMADRLWKTGLAGTPPSELRFFMHPWVIDSSALREAGWSPRYTNAETLEELVEATRSYIAVGRTRVRKGSVAKGAAATLAALGALAVVRKRRAGQP